MAVTSWIRRQFQSGASVTDYLPSGCSAGATTIGVHDGTTFPDGSVGPFIVTLDQGLSTEEQVLMQSRSGATFTVASSGRGYNGSTAQSHPANATILLTINPQDFDEANQVAVQTLGAITASGDLLQGSGSHTLARLARGAANTTLQVVGTSLSYVGFGSSRSQTVGTSNADGTDTTYARSDHVHAGVTPASTTTLTNKRVTRRVVAVTQSATPTINTDNTDVASITGLAQDITSMTTNLSGTPVAGDLLTVQITDNGGVRAITWGSAFEAHSPSLPLTTRQSQQLVVNFSWDAATSKWYCIGVASGLTPLTLAGVASPMAGSGNPGRDSGGYMMQAGESASSFSSGGGGLVFPITFPNGLLAFTAMVEDTAAQLDTMTWKGASAGGISFTLFVNGALYTGSATYSWIAIGW